MLAAGLLCITSFSACSDDDDKNDDKKYSYEMVLELTDAGDLSAAGVAMVKSTFETMEGIVGVQKETSARVNQIFNESVSDIKQDVDKLLKSLPHSEPVKVTYGFYNIDKDKLEFSKVFTY